MIWMKVMETEEEGKERRRRGFRIDGGGKKG